MKKKRIRLGQNKEIKDRRTKKEIRRKLVPTKRRNYKKRQRNKQQERQMMSFCCEAV